MMNKETHMLGKKNTPRPSRSRVFSSVVVVGYACSVLYADHIRYPPSPTPSHLPIDIISTIVELFHA